MGKKKFSSLLIVIPQNLHIPSYLELKKILCFVSFFEAKYDRNQNIWFPLNFIIMNDSPHPSGLNLQKSTKHGKTLPFVGSSFDPRSVLTCFCRWHNDPDLRFQHWNSGNDILLTCQPYSPPCSISQSSRHSTVTEWPSLTHVCRQRQKGQAGT